MVGAPGAANGVTSFDGGDAAPIPALLLAVTVKLYLTPLMRPFTVTGDAVPEPV
jgi:hypothetical protein